MTLADLVDQGWLTEIARGSIFLLAPTLRPSDGQSVADVKARVRASLLVARDRQLREPSVQRFLQSLEARREYAGRHVSVLDLVDDGEDLARRLRELRASPSAEVEEALSDIIRPEIHVASRDERCLHTGLSTLDIWRYFRHTWSLEYRATPGRTLPVLIRNEARPGAPVMGLGMLASAAPHITPRDQWIGWTIEAIAERVFKGEWPHADVAAALSRALAQAIHEIRSEDLGLGLLDLENPTEESIRLLQGVAVNAGQDHDELLVALADSTVDGVTRSAYRRLPTEDGEIDWMAASNRPLFRRKRAATLARLLEARIEFSRAELDDKPSAGLAKLLQEAQGRRAINVALREIKKTAFAAGLADVSVCGAIPPYNHLVVGKLVALLLASEDMRQAYARRYSGQISLIASQLAGRPVTRPAELLVLTTTGLYGVGSSQYNRLRLRAREHPELERDVVWENVGISSGYGTAHLSRETLEALREAQRADDRPRRVHNVFGEGSSPRLREIREGLDGLGVESADVLQHATPRLVYACEIVPGARARMLGFPTRISGAPSSDALAAAWRRRWLLPRLANTDVLERVRATTAAAVAEQLRAVSAAESTPLFPAPAQKSPSPLVQIPQMPPPTPLGGKYPVTSAERETRRQVIRNLYRSASTASDHHSVQTLGMLHVETPVERFISDAARKAKIVFLTGNPGDGKTHLIRMIETQNAFRATTFIRDANDQADDALAAEVDSALKRGAGLIMGINEGTLFNLLRDRRDPGGTKFRAWAQEAWKQLTKPVIYVNTPADAPDIIVVDLNMRNTLDPSITEPALQRIVAGEIHASCEECGSLECPAARNATFLRISAVRDRLLSLLERVSRTGVHIPMRDLQAFFSYLVFGGRTCSALRSADDGATYAALAFDAEAQGALFDALRPFNPAGITHALLDDVLWRGADLPGHWVAGERPTAVNSNGTTLEDRLAQFQRRKQRAYFEHVDGSAIFEQDDQTGRKFRGTTYGGEEISVHRIVADINRFFDRSRDDGNNMYLWVAHRYDARPLRFAASQHVVPAAMLRVRTPSPHPFVRDAFPGFVPNHVLLTLHSDADKGLRVDDDLYAALHAVRQGLPSSYRQGETVQRLATFFDCLTRWASQEESNELTVTFVDMDTGTNSVVRVSVPGRTYIGG